MKQRLLTTFLFITSSLIFAQNTDLEVKAFAEKIDNLENEQLLDVRTPGEWKTGTIPNALKMNFMESNFKEQVSALDKDKPVLVYCAVGGRSAKAQQLLLQWGFKEVYNLLGGINAWQNAGYELKK